MGTRMTNPEVESGNDCGYCSYEPNLVWPPGYTPKTVYVTFHGLNHCPGYSMLLPNGHTFVLKQDPDTPCLWLHDGTIWRCTFYAWTVSNYSEILLGYNPAAKFAFQGINPICPFEFLGFTNLATTCTSNVCCTGGIAVPSWGDLPRDLMEDMGLEFSISSFHEVLPLSVSSSVQRFANVKDATCLKILI